MFFFQITNPKSTFCQKPKSKFIFSKLKVQQSKVKSPFFQSPKHMFLKSTIWNPKSKSQSFKSFESPKSNGLWIRTESCQINTFGVKIILRHDLKSAFKNFKVQPLIQSKNFPFRFFYFSPKNLALRNSKCKYETWSS